MDNIARKHEAQPREERVVRVECGSGYLCEQTVEGSCVEWRYVTWTVEV